MKKQTTGFYLTAVSAIAAAVGLIGYLVNCGTDYFSNLGMDYTVLGCVIAAIVLQVGYVALALKGPKVWLDILPVAVAVLLMVATLLLVSTRVNSIAAVMTYENNARNMADLVSCIIGIAGLLIATVVGIVSAFFDVTRE